MNFALCALRRIAVGLEAAARLLRRTPDDYPVRNRMASVPVRCVPLARQGAFKPLRVLRVMEPGQQRACVGRMVISGRMADVCAELDRLAACEAAIS